MPYPLPKLDQIAIPGGFGGAMENWGGITYYESALLFDPEKSSAATKQDIYEVIAHEMAHMWFGDLVTMAWWDNLWLNEGFASWMGTKCTAHFNPQWEVWLRKTCTARSHSARRHSARKRPWKATRVRRRIRFNKRSPLKRKRTAPSTTSPTKKGSRSFGCSRVSWAKKFSVTASANTSRITNFRTRLRPISGIRLSEARANRLVKFPPAGREQPGFPVVKVARTESARVGLTQERFTLHFPKRPPLEWKIPLTYSVADAKRHRPVC